jgi:hypothetical protein
MPFLMGLFFFSRTNPEKKRRHAMAYKRTVCALLLFAAACLVFPTAARAIGLEVDPVEINLTNVPLGKRIAISEIGGEKMKLLIEKIKSASQPIPQKPQTCT